MPLHGEAKIAYYRAYNAKRRKSGTCLRCKSPAVGELCESHLKARREYLAKKKEKVCLELEQLRDARHSQRVSTG